MGRMLIIILKIISLPLSGCLAVSHTLSHTHSLSHTVSHTHSLSHTHTLSGSLFLTLFCHHRRRSEAPGGCNCNEYPAGPHIHKLSEVDEATKTKVR